MSGLRHGEDRGHAHGRSVHGAAGEAREASVGVGQSLRGLLSPTALAVAQAEQERAANDDVEPTSAQLSPEEQEVVNELKQIDAETRRHEQAHAAVGGEFAGSPSYTYQTGPDGRNYAVGGEVSIDVSPIDGDPQATIDKMRTVKRAALAPAEPSSQDRKVAAQADAQLAAAQAELAQQRSDELGGETDEATTSDGPTLGIELAEPGENGQRADDPFSVDPATPLGGQVNRPAVDPARIVNISV